MYEGCFQTLSAKIHIMELKVCHMKGKVGEKDAPGDRSRARGAIAV
jgi:hypothetical protein